MSEQQNLLGKQNYEYQEQDENYKGRPLDTQIGNGPLENQDRGCKDLFWFLLYVLFWGGLIFVAILAFERGNPRYLAAPFDPSGNQCGFGQAEDYPYLYFSNPTSVLTTIQYSCVKSCPNYTNTTVSCLPNSVVTTCPINNYASSEFVSVCIPSNKSFYDNILSLINLSDSEEWMSDIKNTWEVQLSVLGMAFVLGFIFMILTKYCGGFLTWFIILMYFALLITLGALCIVWSSPDQHQNLPPQLQDKEALKIIGYILLSIAGISLLLFICFFSRIKKAIAIMKAACDFTKSESSILLVPIVQFICVSGFFVFWVYVSLYIFSSGTVVQNPTSPFGNIEWDVGVKRCLTYYLFGLFWNCEFTIAMSHFIIASTCAIWYFSHHSSHGSKHTHPIAKSIKRGFIYHLGSICLGSLILAAVLIIRVLLEVTYKQAKQASQANQDPAAKCALFFIKCCRCCVSCFERFIRFLNDNAFIMIALNGESFCTAAHDAFYLIVRNASLSMISHGLGKIFVLFGQFFICLGSTIGGYLMMTQLSRYSDQIYEPTIPTIFFFIISYVVGQIFMNVFGMAADTLILCVASDMELNRQAKSMPPSLKDFLNDYN